MALIMAGDHTDYAAIHPKHDQDGTLGARNSLEQAGGIKQLESSFAALFEATARLSKRDNDRPGPRQGK
ncbi:hypothetical protein ACIPV2_00195 [Microbacterium sp. NPDC089987]|uniref:hypothetical protein n=1 Tax=Microbacterium sp. NPDC089987 TaxID=3364202 RepID=UPI0037F69C9E